MFRPICMSIAFLGCFTLGIQSLAEGNTTYLLNNTTPLPANGGQAMCFTGIIPLIVTSNNTRLNYAEPTDQFLLTQTVVEVLQANSPLPASLDPKPNIITGTYNIFGKLCLPSAPNGSFSAVQILTHGGMLNSTYWDIAPDYSYVSAAAAAGYATFSYDRIGTGLSDHPDPIQVVQLALSVEILHKFISLLRNGALGGHAFERVVGVGHSVGSAVTQAVTTLYPDDLDAVALTGYSTTPNSSLVTLASFDLIPANADPNGRFKDLPNAYVLQSTSQSLQFAFYHYPNFDASIFQSQYQYRDVTSLGELLATTGFQASPSSGFKGPVAIVNGQNDLVFCFGDCAVPSDAGEEIIRLLYPAASPNSKSFIVPQTGHAINAHKSAPEAFEDVNDWLHGLGF